MPFCASSEGSGKSAHLHRLTLAFVTVQISCAALIGDLCAIHASSEYSGESAHLRRQSLDNVINIRSLVLAAEALGSMHVCTGSPEPSIQYQNIMCWLKWRFLQCLCEQRMMWCVCTSNRRNSVQPSVRCINASKNASSAL